MTNTADRVTRVASDLMDSAVVEGVRNGRSAKQQLEHWARVGREISSQQTAARRRVELALTGGLELRELNAEEGVVVNAEIAAAIQESLVKSNYGKALAERGITTVALNDSGDIVEHLPDGSSVMLTANPPHRRNACDQPKR
jgi:ParD-like antitoxin of type II bacterial toxin-antitoxin system